MKTFLTIFLSLLLIASFSFSTGCKKAEKPTELPKPAVAPKPAEKVASIEEKSADYHFQKAHEFFLKKETKSTGNALKDAAQHLKQAAKWSGHKFEAGAAEVIKGALTAADKLIEGARWTAEEVGKGIKDIGNEISKLGEKIKPAKK